MSSTQSILVWCCAGIVMIGASAIQALELQNILTSPSSIHQLKERDALEAKRPSCQTPLPEDKAAGLAKLINGFLSVLATQSKERVAVDLSWNANSFSALNCTTAIYELETSIWIILRRVWLATSCQYSEEEYDQAIRQVEDAGSKMLTILGNVEVISRNDTVKTDYYQNTITKARSILLQTIQKMREAQGTGRCHSSVVLNLAENFEEALREVKSQKKATAALQEETRQALAAIKSLKEETEKTLRAVASEKEEIKTALAVVKREREESQIAVATVHVQKAEIKEAFEMLKIQREETERALVRLESEKEAREKALEFMRSGIDRTDMVAQEVRAQKEKTSAALLEIESQGKQLEELRSLIFNQSSKTEDAIAAVEMAEGRLTRQQEELKTKDSVSEETLVTQGGELEAFKTNLSEMIFAQAEKIRDQDELLEKLNAKIFRPTPTSSSTTTTAATSTSPTPSTTTTTPATTSSPSCSSALECYRKYGFAGLSGRAVNLENEYYKGEYLYLARNPTDRNASVFDDGATLAVGEERLGESAFLWEFIPVPGEGNYTFYLRNKLNEQKPLASRQGGYGRSNYISLEVVYSAESAQPNQLLIYMQETIRYEYYYHPVSTPNTDSALNGREIWAIPSKRTAGNVWVVHFAS